MSILFRVKGNWDKTEKFLKRSSEGDIFKNLERFGEMGISALQDATPKDTGFTASSWSYRIERDSKGVTITWENSHVEKGWANIAILLQFGHGTRNGGYVKGRDYINPAMRPIFDKIAEDAWREVTR